MGFRDSIAICNNSPCNCLLMMRIRQMLTGHHYLIGPAVTIVHRHCHRCFLVYPSEPVISRGPTKEHLFLKKISKLRCIRQLSQLKKTAFECYRTIGLVLFLARNASRYQIRIRFFQGENCDKSYVLALTMEYLPTLLSHIFVSLISLSRKSKLTQRKKVQNNQK